MFMFYIFNQTLSPCLSPAHVGQMDQGEPEEAHAGLKRIDVKIESTNKLIHTRDRQVNTALTD